jgi:hypothetical protein
MNGWIRLAANVADDWNCFGWLPIVAELNLGLIENRRILFYIGIVDD